MKPITGKRIATGAGVMTSSGRDDASLSLLDRFLSWRDKTVAKPEFRRWAARFPLTRHVARRQSAKLFDICSGFVKTQTILASLQSGLLDALADGPRTVSELQAVTGLSQQSLERLLMAASALELIGPRSVGRYGLGSLGPAVVGDAGIRAMIEHNSVFYRDITDPVGLLKGEMASTELQSYWAYSGNGQAADLGQGEVAQYSVLMALSQQMVAEEVLAAYRLSRHKWLLDVGGGQGAFVAAAGAVATGLKLSVFDLPAVAERAGEQMAALGFADRFEPFGGDFLAGSLPTGPDVYSLVRVLHDHDDAEAMAILKNVRAACKPGATLLIAESMAGVLASAAISEIYFGFYFAAMGRGRTRTPDELAVMLKNAGFSQSRVVATNTPIITQLVVATA